MLAAASVCDHRVPAGGPEKIVFHTALGELPVRVEIARSEQERAQGLMHRESLGAHDGMLFVFPTTGRHSFWMKNTLISLDIVFIGESGRVVGIVADAEPLTLTSRRVSTPSRYVVEINGGSAARYGIEIGTRVDLPPAR